MSKKTEAKCNGAMLTVGFHAANPPLIWRFDLERNHSFTLALQGEDGDWELGVTSPKGDFYPVVHFIAREDAEEAFAKVEKVLGKRSTVWGAVGKAILYVAAVAVIIVVGVSSYGLYVTHHASSPIGGVSSAAPVAMPSGVPVTADDVLKPPPN